MYLSIFILVSKTRSCFVRLSFGNINLLKIFIFFPRIAHIENNILISISNISYFYLNILIPYFNIL